MPADIPDDIGDAIDKHFADDTETLVAILAFLTNCEKQDDADCYLKQLRRYLDKPDVFKPYVRRIAKKANDPENQQKTQEMYDFLNEDLKGDHNALAALVQNKPLLIETKRNFGFYYALSRCSPFVQKKIVVHVGTKSMQIVALSSATQLARFQKATKIVGVVIVVGKFGYEFYKNIKQWKNNQISAKRCAKNIVDEAGELIGNCFGGAVGATYGASAGAIFGPVGFVVGGVAGGVLGSLMGADLFRNWFAKKTEEILSCPADIAVERAYDFFGLSPTCSKADINKRYKELSKIYHPDKGGDQEKFVELQTHHALLKAAKDD